MDRTKIPPKMALDALEEVIAHFKPSLNGGPQRDFFQALADRVNKFSGENWTYRYLLSVQNQTVAPSQRFARAIVDLAASLDSTLPDLLVRSVNVTISAAPGAIHAGAYVMGTSKTCANPQCNLTFVPSVPWRAFCPVCRPPRGVK